MIKIKHHQHQAVEWYRTGAYPFGKPKMYVNCFLIDGLLIDTAAPNVRSQFLPILQQHTIEQILLTHHHEDHSGNLPQLQKILGCPAYAHPLTNDFIKKPHRISFAQQITWGQNDPAETIPLNLSIPFKTPNYEFQLIHTPGHAADHLALYEKNQGWLFSGDLYVYDYIRYFMRSESVVTQINSLKKVLKLDFDVAFCAHNVQLKNPKSRFQAKLQFFEDFFGKVKTLHEKGLSSKAIMKELGMKEDWGIKLLSQGELSSENMVRSVIRDLNVL